MLAQIGVKDYKFLVFYDHRGRPAPRPANHTNSYELCSIIAVTSSSSCLLPGFPLVIDIRTRRRRIVIYPYLYSETLLVLVQIERDFPERPLAEFLHFHIVVDPLRVVVVLHLMQDVRVNHVLLRSTSGNNRLLATFTRDETPQRRHEVSRSEATRETYISKISSSERKGER